MRILLVVLLLMLPLVLPGTLGDSFTQEGATAFNTQRKVVRDASGNLYVARVVHQGNTDAVFISTSADGRSWRDVTTVSSPGVSGLRPSLALDSHGAIHVAWTELVDSDRRVLHGILQGSTVAGREVISPAEGYAGFPSMALDRDGNLHVVWYGLVGTAYQVHHRIWNVAGWGPAEVITASQLDAVNPTIAADPSGGLHVAYFQSDDRSTRVMYMEDHGQGWTTPRTISPAAGDAVDPSLVVAPDGGVRVAFALSGPSGDQILLWDGAGLTPITQASGVAHPSLALDGQGNLNAFWDAADGQIHRRAFNGTWGPPEVLSPGGRNLYPSARWQQFPRMAGPVDVVWTVRGEASEALGYGFVGQPFRPAAPAGSISPWATAAAATVGALGVVVAVRWRVRRKPPRGTPHAPRRPGGRGSTARRLGEGFRRFMRHRRQRTSEDEGILREMRDRTAADMCAHKLKVDWSKGRWE